MIISLSGDSISSTGGLRGDVSADANRKRKWKEPGGIILKLVVRMIGVKSPGGDSGEHANDKTN